MLEYSDAGLARATYSRRSLSIWARMWRWLKRLFRLTPKLLPVTPLANMISGICTECGGQATELWVCFGQTSWMCGCGYWWPMRNKTKRKRRRRKRC